MFRSILDAVYSNRGMTASLSPTEGLFYWQIRGSRPHSSHHKALRLLTDRYPGFDGLAECDQRDLVELLRPCGVDKRTALCIAENAKSLKKRFGAVSTEPLRRWPEDRAIDFLQGLKGITETSAGWILLNAGRDVVPPDRDIIVVCERIGFIERGLINRTAAGRLRAYPSEPAVADFCTGLKSHAAKKCGKNPKCGICEVKKFCLEWREDNKSDEGHKPRAADLFCGCGGASYGLQKAGFDIVFAADNNQTAIDTYYLNFPAKTFSEVKCADIYGVDGHTLADDHKLDVMFGGPPCQGWSNIGKTRKNGNNGNSYFTDEKNKLFFQFLRILKEAKPRFFVMENVPGLTTAHEGKYEQAIRSEFEQAGYEVRRTILNAAEFGIPQNRERLFFIGLSPDDRYPTDCLDTILGRIDAMKCEEPKTFRSGLKGLPSLRPGEGAEVAYGGPILQGSRSAGGRRGLFFNHSSRPHNARDLNIYSEIKEGEDYLHFSRRIDDEKMLPYSLDSFHTKYRKIDGSKPCFTIISHLCRDSNSYIHPDDNRGITVREAARIQSFPDDFVFLGVDFRNFILVGNAVPPDLSSVIGRSIHEEIVNRSGEDDAS